MPLDEPAEGAVGLAEELVGAVFGGIEDEVVSAEVGDGGAAEGFFEFGEALPGVIGGGVGGGDAPEIEEFEAFRLGVKDGLAEDGDVGGEAFELGAGVGARLHVEAGVGVVEEEGGADDLVVEMGEIEDCEGLG